MMKFLHLMKDDLLTLSVGKGISSIERYVDAAFGVHPDYKGHTGAAMKFEEGKGSLLQKSSKQKLNTSSSTTCELVGVDDTLPKISVGTAIPRRTRLYIVENNVIMQDNQSAILLEKKRKAKFGRENKGIKYKIFFSHGSHRER